MKRSRQSGLLLLALLVSSHLAVAAASDGGMDASGEAGAPGKVVGDAGASAALEPPEYSPLKCDGSLCDTTTGETTCSMSEGRSAKGGAWPFVMALALAAAGIRRRAQRSVRRAA